MWTANIRALFLLSLFALAGLKQPPSAEDREKKFSESNLSTKLSLKESNASFFVAARF